MPPIHQIIIDPGGRLACRDKNEFNVFFLDPFSIVDVAPGLRRSFNPLDLLDPNDKNIIYRSEVVAKAMALAQPNQNTSEFWDHEAASMIKGIILHVKTNPKFDGRRHLVTLREQIVNLDAKGLAENTALDGCITSVGKAIQDMQDNSPQQWGGCLRDHEDVHRISC